MQGADARCGAYAGYCEAPSGGYSLAYSDKGDLVGLMLDLISIP